MWEQLRAHVHAVRDTLVHFGAVVADAPSPLSTPRSAAGQARLRLGKPLRKEWRASPDAFRHAGRVVAGTVGIVRATVPFHGEHDAQEPTKVKRGQGGARKRARSRTLTNTLAVFLARGRPGGPSSAYRTDIAPPGRRPLPGQPEQQRPPTPISWTWQLAAAAPTTGAPGVKKCEIL